MFPFRSFMVSCLTCKSLVHLKGIFVYDVIEGPFLLLCMWLSSISITTYERDCPFQIVYSWLLCQKLTDYILMCYFQAPCSVPLTYVSVFRPVPYCFDYYNFVIQFETRMHDGSSFDLLLQGNLCDFTSPFQDCFSISVRNVTGIWMTTALNLQVTWMVWTF